ncbi:hypothetical protein [Curtobacterium sp. 24E2]|nr:hypothetical protein JN350_10910 [Curtobacterium sp. 24E2]
MMTHSSRPFPSAQRIVDASNFYSDDDVRLVPNSRALVASLDLISADVGDVVSACAAVLARYVAVADSATVAFDVTTTTGQIQRRSFVIKPDAVVSDIAEGYLLGSRTPGTHARRSSCHFFLFSSVTEVAPARIRAAAVLGRWRS